MLEKLNISEIIIDKYIRNHGGIQIMGFYNGINSDLCETFSDLL